MGSSLILKGGASVPRTVQETIIRSNSFVAGDVVRFDPAAGPQGTWYKSQANSAENAEVVGVVLSASTASFDVVYGGYLQLSAFSGVSAPVLFLDSVVPGGLTTNPPSAIGSVVKPVLTRTTTAGGYVVTNYLGTQIGGSSTISVDEIQPVGTIMPFAGTVIPDTWLECNGQPVGVTAYPELYDKLLYTALPRAPMYGHRVRLTGTGLVTENFAVDDVIQFKTGTAAWTGGLYDSNCTVLGRIVSLTTSTSATAAGTMVVQMLAKYDITADGVNAAQRRSFSYPNALFVAGTGVASQTAAAAGYRVFRSDGFYRTSTSNISVTSVSITDFLTPDLRGRFSLGKKTDAIWINEFDGDAANQQSIGSFYDQGVFGGEEQHLLSVPELPSHSHNLKTLINAFPITPADGNLIGPDNHNANYNGTVDPSKTGSDGLPPRTATQGSNTPHNNMPPYLAMRHIIKAKPYTRAAIIDDIDIPYSQLLITDLRTRNIGGSNADLVFKANRDGDTGLGTEEMRLSGTTGRLTLHENNGTYDVSISGYGQNCLNVSSPLGGTIVLTDSDTTTANQYRNRWISNQDGILLFGRANDDGTSPTTQMQMDYVGDVGIGVAPISIGADIRTLDVAGSVGGGVRLRGTGTSPVSFASYCTSNDSWLGTITNHPLFITTNNLERVRINELGQIRIGGYNTTSLLTGTTGGNNVATIGRSPSNSLTIGGAGNDYAGIGFNIEYQSTSGSYKYRGADWASLLVWKQGGFEFLGNSTQGTAAGSLTLTSFMVISNTGNVGIGVAPDTTNRLKVSGKILATDDITAFSDARYKTNVLPIANSLDRVCALNGVLYTDTNGNRKTGLLAQDVQSVLPEAVSADSDGKLALAYGNLAGLIVEALKELKLRVDAISSKSGD